MGFSPGRGLRLAEALPALFIWGRAGSRPGFWRGVPDRREGASPQPPARRGVLIRGPQRLLGADDGVEDVLERAWERRALRQEFL